MKLLILSCNTGEGHNAAGRAVKAYAESAGHQAILLDYMKLASEKTSKRVGNTYINVAKYTPRLFYMAYRLGGWISSSKRKSPVYWANHFMAKYLKQYLDDHEIDVIVMPHLFPAETITYMKKRGMLKQKTVVIATDYTCIPFWEETQCDYYILPHDSLKEEFAKRGIPAEKLLGFGIPVHPDFTIRREQKAEKKMLKLPEKKPLYLIMGGSMGFGKIQLFTYELLQQLNQGEQIVVICGTNEKLKRTMQRIFRKEMQVHVIGYTNHVSRYLDACDVVYTKPGGLTSTEVAVKQKALIHTAPIPGCETKNRDFFVKRGMSMTANHIKEQIALGKLLVENKLLREGMLAAQKENSNPDAAKDIVELLLKLCQEELNN